MSDLKFSATHRILIVANATGHGYKTVRIDVDNGTFYNDDDVKSDNTKIRVNKGIHAEKLCYNGDKDYNLPLKDKTALEVISQFNVKRSELGFEPLEFFRVKYAHAKSL